MGEGDAHAFFLKNPSRLQVDDFVKYIAKEATSELVGFDRSGNAKAKTEL